MSTYNLKTNINGGLGELACKVVNNREICQWLQDNIPEATEVRKFSEPLQIEEPELLKIIESRLDRLDKARSSGLLSVGNPDYLFSEFLERGLCCSDAVCLLVRGFQLEELIDKIKDCPTKDIPEVLRWLSKKLELRLGKHPGGTEDCWIDAENPTKTVSEALKDPDVKEDLDKLRDEIGQEPTEEAKRWKGTIDVPFATGFLVGRNYLMTNSHVFNDRNREEINNFSAYFRYENNAFGDEIEEIRYEFDPEVCISGELLDFTIVGVKPEENLERSSLNFPEAGNNFGWLPMLADPILAAPPIKRQQISKELQENNFNIPKTDLAGEAVFIMQHPRGTRKKFFLFNNSIQAMYQKFLLMKLIQTLVLLEVLF
jgi:hypothetical protein